MDTSGFMLKLSLQAGVAVVKNKRPIIDFISNRAAGIMRTDIVVTGHHNVGKSILLNKMQSMLKSKYPVKPSMSEDVEINVIRVNDDFFPAKAVVIPGQKNREQIDGFRKFITNNNNLKGVIHVVDWGYTKPRDRNIEMDYVARDIKSIEDLRNIMLESELQYLSSLIEILKGAKSSLKWMIVVINKADLFHDRQHDAWYYYNVKSEFQKKLSELQSYFGNNFSLDYHFSISSRDNFHYNNEHLHSVVDEKMSEDDLVNGLINAIGLKLQGRG